MLYVPFDYGIAEYRTHTDERHSDQREEDHQMAISKDEFHNREKLLSPDQRELADRIEYAIDKYARKVASEEYGECRLEEMTFEDLGLEKVSVPANVIWELQRRYKEAGWREFGLWIHNDDRETFFLTK